MYARRCGQPLGQNDGSIFDDDDDDDAALLMGGGDQGAGGSNGSAGICCAHDHHMYRALISYCMYAARIDQALQRKYVDEMEVLLAEGISCPVDDLTLEFMAVMHEHGLSNVQADGILHFIPSPC